jgi:4-diphosphocytidyl-2-C-methyl-D-erythritol kinase
MQAIDLYDDVTVSYSPVSIDKNGNGNGEPGLGLVIRVSMTAEPYVTDRIDDFIPDPKDNIAYSAAELYCLTFFPELTGEISLQLHKRIPAAAGLAGGSADAAAVVLALNHLSPFGSSRPGYPSPKELARFAARLGADVPFCIASTAKNNPDIAAELTDMDADADNPGIIVTSSALCEGIGDILTPAPSAMGHVILIKPDIDISTPLVYKLFDDSGTAYTNNPSPSCSLWGDNALEPITTAAFPLVLKLLDEVRRIAAGADLIYMTGSGPTIVAVYPDAPGSEVTSETVPVPVPESLLDDFDALQEKFEHRTDVRAVLIAKLL